MTNGTKETGENANNETSADKQIITTENTADKQADKTTSSTETTEKPETSATDNSAASAAAAATSDKTSSSENDNASAKQKDADINDSEKQTASNAENSADEESVDSDEQQNEIDFGAILDEFEQEQTDFYNGMLVEGKVVKVSDHGAVIDFGYKSEGIVPIEEFTNSEGEVTIKKGDTVEVVIKSIYIGDSPPQLSKDDAISRKSWDLIEQAHNNDEIIKGTVSSKTKGGLQVDIEGVEAFLPGSLVDSRPVRSLDAFIGQEIEAKVIKFSRKRNNIVISRKALTDEVMDKLKEETLSSIEENYVVEGVVKNLTEYGAFVDIGGIDGLLHVTDMSWGRLQNPNQQFKVNDTIQVKILKLEREKEKVSLGYKQLLPDPWSSVVEIYPVDERVKGTVSSVTDYGAFVELEPGVEGLVHVSEMSWSKRNKSPKKILRQGEEIEVQILGIDTDERRISLGMKQLQENPWDTIAERFPVGTRIKGKVRNLTDFGAFVEVEEGVDGLVHVSDISHKNIKHPKDVLKRDQEVEAVITNVNPSEQRLSLSMKELTPSAWDRFVENHKPGDVVKGEVSRFAGFGVFVKLDEDLEGLCHISELSEERIEKPEDVVSIGQVLDFKILRIELDVEKIGLSHRAVGKEDETVVDSKSYSTEAKGGMASLGELANLQFGGGGETADEEEQSDQPKKSKKERRAEKARLKAEAEAYEETAPDETIENESEQAEETADTSDETKAETKTAEEGKAETADEGKPEEANAVEAETAKTDAEPAAENAVEKTEETAPKAEPAAEEKVEAVSADPVSEVNEATESVEEEKDTPASAEDETQVQAETETAESAETADSAKAETANSETDGDNKPEADEAGAKKKDES